MSYYVFLFKLRLIEWDLVIIHNVKDDKDSIEILMILDRWQRMEVGSDERRKEFVLPSRWRLHELLFLLFRCGQCIPSYGEDLGVRGWIGRWLGDRWGLKLRPWEESIATWGNIPWGRAFFLEWDVRMPLLFSVPPLKFLTRVMEVLVDRCWPYQRLPFTCMPWCERDRWQEGWAWLWDWH